MRAPGLLQLATVLILAATSSTVHAGQVEKGPYLIYTGEATSMMVLWQLDSTDFCTLEWGEDLSYSGGSVQTAESGHDHQHIYTIPALTPGTEYHYRVSADQVHTGSFRTAPPSTEDTVKFLAYGDTRSNPTAQDMVNGRMIETFEGDEEFQTFTLHVGDWVGNGQLEAHWTSQFFDRSKANLLKMQANLPIQGCRGNHEGDGVLYEKYWPYPYEPGGQYWSFDYGPMHFAVVDQYVDYLPGSRQLAWLEKDLAASDKTWKFLLFHEPGWSAGNHSNEVPVQRHIQPLCLAYGVDILFCGHNHYYAHCDVDGIKHITTGGGGAPLKDPDLGMPRVVTAAKAYHFCEIQVLGRLLTFTTREDTGDEIDSFVLSDPYVPALPWSDDFESGDLIAGGWRSGGTVDVVADSHGGTFAARTEGTASLERIISTEGLTDIRVRYVRKTEGLSANEYLVIEWFDGTGWNLLESTQDTAWIFQDIPLPVAANDNVSFKLRFHASGLGNQAYTFVDDVEITGMLTDPDVTPPAPDPMTWAALPQATSKFSIAMSATPAFDLGGVEYYFDCTTVGGHDSGWQDDPFYLDSKLEPGTEYTYRVTARDKTTHRNQNGFSPGEAATTLPGDPDEPGIAYCFGDPDGHPCPCDNQNDGSMPGSGCRNGVGNAGAKLAGSGYPSVGEDLVQLTVSGVEPNRFGLFFQADNALDAGPMFGDGLLCASWNLIWLEARISDSSGLASSTVTLSAEAGCQPGDTKRYQYWYHNPTSSPCGAGHNTTNGYEIVWQP